MSLLEKITTAQADADIEMTQFLGSLSDPASYAGMNMDAALSRVKASKLDRFQYLSEDLTGTDNNITSTAYYIQRTKDLTDLATDIDKVATKQINASVVNTGLIGRQEEINEWANHNKLDTLFFLQILFITLTFISSMVFFNSNGLISSYLLNLWIVLASFLAVFVLITRARKTAVLRDGRYWHKFRYGSAKAPPEKNAKTCPGDEPPLVVEPTVEPEPTCSSAALPGAPPPPPPGVA